MCIWRNIDPHQFSIGVNCSCYTTLNPAQQQPVVFVGIAKPNATTVRFLASGFIQEQAILWEGERDTPPSRIFHDRVIVHVGIEAEERQRKSVLTTRLAMAWT